MARYIDADKFIERIKVSPAFPNMGTDGEFLRDVTINLLNNAPAADVVPKSVIEKLKAELDRERAGHPFGMTIFELQACEEHAAITAVKEVWRDLRSMCDAPHWCVWLSEIDDYFEKKTGGTPKDITELKKKYITEGE